jgi:hypothetical protein
MDNCGKCGKSTRRKDGLCPNCYYLTVGWYGRNSQLDVFIIEEELKGKCVDCGITDARVLRITKKDGTEQGEQQPLLDTNAHLRRMFAFNAQGSPQNYFVRCESCWDRFRKSTGRPPKYKTPEERAAAERQSQKKWEQNIKQKAIDLYDRGQCLDCGVPATRLLYVGPPGEGPNRRDYISKYVHIVKNPAAHKDLYAPFCYFHGDMHLPERLHAARWAKAQRMAETAA